MTIVVLHRQQRETFAQRTILRENPDVDELDYHFMAVNFAVANKFPYLGYLADTGRYNLSFKRGVSLGVDSVYLNMFQEAGPVLAFTRLPMYSLLVGLMYKAFGVKLSVLLWLNILLSALSCALLPSMGYRLWGREGAIAGIAGSVLWLVVSSFSYELMDIEILGSFLYLALFLLVVGRSDRAGWVYWCSTGVVTGLALLTRPTFMPMIPFYVVYLFISERGKGMFRRAILGTLLGIAFVMAPWTTYISIQKNETLEQRKAWCEKISAKIEKGVFESPEQLNRDQHQMTIGIRNLVRYVYMYYTGVKGSGVLTGDGFLYLNNEYCIYNVSDNGTFGWLWKVIPTSYYNTHDQGSGNAVIRIYHFYRDNPRYMYLIPAERIKYSTAYPLIFWLAPALLSLCLLRIRLGEGRPGWLRILLVCVAAGLTYSAFRGTWPGWIQVLVYVPFYLMGIWCMRGIHLRLPVVYFLFWIGIFLFLFFIYGDQRFITISLPINCLMTPLFIIALLTRAKPLIT
ncbi:MAG: glycosyltransferase family 39 protein [Bacteroidetes bacterium]|nr:glycosyltransferase family 39 protein [Bacteroidota bacterium]